MLSSHVSYSDPRATLIVCAIIVTFLVVLLPHISYYTTCEYLEHFVGDFTFKNPPGVFRSPRAFLETINI